MTWTLASDWSRETGPAEPRSGTINWFKSSHELLVTLQSNYFLDPGYYKQSSLQNTKTRFKYELSQLLAISPNWSARVIIVLPCLVTYTEIFNVDNWLKNHFFFFSVRSLSEDELLLLSPEELCKDRLSEEYFRLKADYDGGDCRDVVR